MLFFYPLSAQNNQEQGQCLTSEMSNLLVATLPTTGCDNFIKYAPVIPSFMPIKTVQVVIHVVRQDDGTRNFQDTPVDRGHIHNLIDRVNDDYGNLWYLSHIDPSCIPETITDTRIRFSLWPTIFFHDDSDFFCDGQSHNSDMYDLYVTNNINVSADLEENAIHIFLTGCSVISGTTTFTANAGIASGVPANNKKYTYQGGYYNQLIEEPVPWALVQAALTTGHELGHCLGLGHVFYDDSCCDTVDPPMAGDTNNMMDYYPNRSRRLTECQMARMHYYLEGKCDLSGFCGSIHNTVITDYCNKDETYDVIIPSGDNVVWEVDRKLTTDIIIETGAQLTIKCKLGLPTDANIIVNRGARLFVDGGTITHNKTMWDKCDEGQWGRIYVYGNTNVPHTLNMRGEFHTLNSEEPGIVLIKNGATLEYARHAISTKALGIPWPELQDYWGGFVYAENSFFINNHRSVEFMKYDYKNYSAFVNCKFINEDGTANVGVTNWATSGVAFYRCGFKNINETGIGTYDASMKITRSNFEGIHQAISAFATGPILSNFEIGSDNISLGNSFTFNDVAISATGISKLVIKNNTFENNEFGIAVSGESGYRIQYNHFSESSAAIDLVQTGSTYFNSINCNVFENDFIGIDITGDNSEMRFRNQDFTTTYDVFLSNEGSDVGKLAEQGSSLHAVWNYFSSTSNNLKHINTTGLTEAFLYNHPNPNLNNRIKPDCALNDNCSSVDTENFINNLAPGGFAECTEDQITPNDISKDKLQELNELINEINLINNPTEQGRLLLVELEEEKQIVFWTLLQLYHGDQAYLEMDTLLLTENTKTAQKYRIGLKIDMEAFAVATTLVNDFIVETLDDQYFKFTQQININRLSQNFDLSIADEDMLHLIVEARTPASAYAKALLSILKGEVFEPELPEIVQALTMPNNGVGAVREVREDKKRIKKNLFKEKILIYPNPAKDMINFDLSEYQTVVELEIYNTQGHQIYRQNSSPDLISINTSILGKGLFVVIIKQEGEIRESHKFIISK